MRCFLTLLSLLVLGFGCQSRSQKTKHHPDLRINIQEEPQTLDPRKTRSLSGQTLMKMLFEGLTRVGRDEKAELALAETVMISSDFKTYTFLLRECVWTNGDPVLASDFAYAWKKVLAPDFPSDSSFHLYVIKNAKAAKEGKVSLDEVGVRALDETTLEVELENPIPYFLELVSQAVFFPVCQRVDEKNPAWAQKTKSYVGNGPFQLAEWVHQDHLTLVKNLQYWDASDVKISTLQLQMLQEGTELKCFEKNELDWAGSPLSTLPVDALDSLRKENKLQTKEFLGTFFIRVNTQSPPFQDSSMRRAFAMAIDRKGLVDHVTQGNQIPATALVPLSLGLQKTPYFQDKDIEEAKRLFEEALAERHLSRNDLGEISLFYRMSERNHLVAQAIQQQWFEVFGIRVKLESAEGKVYFDRVSKQDFQLSFGSWTADFQDPINFLEVFKYRNGGSNNTHWENSQFALLLDQSAQTFDFAERMELLRRSEKILIDEMPIIPLFYYSMLYVNQPRLKDVVLSSMGQMDFKWAKVIDEKLIAKEESHD